MKKNYRNKVILKYLKAKYCMSIRKLATLSGCQKSKVERWLSRDYPDSAPDTCSLVGIVVQLAAHQKKIDKMLAIKALEAKIAKAQQDLNSEDSE